MQGSTPIPAAVENWLARARRVAVGETVGIAPDDRSHFVQSGWLVHSRILSDGRRQIVRLLLGGDYVPPLSLAADARDAVTVLAAGTVSSIPHREVQKTAANCADVQSWLDRESRRREALLSERIVSLGKRSGCERTAHFICELIFRYSGPVSSVCEWPLTQADLADALGLSVVHVNRMLQVLRSNGFVVIGRGWVQIPDFEVTARMCGFDHSYLE